MADDLTIIKGGTIYQLPSGWALTDIGSYSFNNKMQDRAFAHGSDCVGDGKVSGRTITVEFDLEDSSEENHDVLVNEAYRYFAQADYQLLVGRTDRVFKVAGISKIKHKFEKGFKQRWSNVTVSLLLADPFRYATSQTVIANTYVEAQSETNISFSNPSSIDVPLIFEFTPTVAMPAVTIYHVESGKSFTMQDTLLSTPAVAAVNAEEGTVYRDSSNSINTLSGVFLHALPGTNNFRYTGNAGTIKIKFTARWFV